MSEFLPNILSAPRTVLLLAMALVFARPAVAGALPCNGDPDLCGRAFDTVTFAGAHNAMSNAADGWFLPNHFAAIPAQLAAGIRVLSLDIHYEQGEVMLCHSHCSLGRAPLSRVLGQIKGFLDTHPREVVAIEFESYVKAEDAAAVFDAAGLSSLAYAPPGTDAPWPTLGQMIDSNKRLVVLSGNAAHGPNWFLDESAFLGASPWYHEKISGFTCGDPAGKPLYLLSHFLYGPHPHPGLARKANQKKVIVGRALDCWRQTGRRPNIIMVDFASVGDVTAAVDTLNHMHAPPPEDG